MCGKYYAKETYLVKANNQDITTEGYVKPNKEREQINTKFNYLATANNAMANIKSAKYRVGRVVIVIFMQGL